MQKAHTRTFGSPVVVVPDNASLRHVGQALKNAGVAPLAVVSKKAGYAKEAIAALGRGPSVLLLVPSLKLDNHQFTLIRKVKKAGGIALVWSSGATSTETKDRDQWLLERLLEQQGAVTGSHLAVLIEALRILAFQGELPRHAPPLKRQSNSMTTRIVSAFKKAGINTSKPKKAMCTIEVSKNGEILLKKSSKKHLVLSDTATAAEAFSILQKADTSKKAIKEPVIEPLKHEIDFIARPPRRLLSETTSKRLLAAYGMVAPMEKLCQSASEATRFAESLESPAVLKLVKPALENKQAKGAIKTNIEGPAAVRRAFHTLKSLATSLGPPNALGILVAKQIDGGARIWLKTIDHNRFGRVLLIGKGDTETRAPVVAFATPATKAQTVLALTEACLVSDSNESESLGEAVARFSTLANDLGDRISRAEIDPLVATEQATEALALDAFFEISDPKEMSKNAF